MPVARSARRLVAACAAVVLPHAAGAQLPGAPVLQNAFSNPGLTVAGNYAGGKETSLIAAAVAYVPGAGGFQFSGGVGRLTPDEGESLTAYGVRVARPVFSFATGRGGVALFGGAGGANADSVSLLQLPLGVGVGWRMGLGATRALSVYGTGTYMWARAKVGDESTSKGSARFAVAGDVTVIRNLALTVGFEGGASSDDGVGPSGSILGAGLSWAFR